MTIGNIDTACIKVIMSILFLSTVVNFFLLYNLVVIKPFLSVIIPTHNNADEILLTILDVHRHLEDQLYKSEILVVDDGSTDNTQEMINRYQPLIKNLKFIANDNRSRGKGFAIKQAMFLSTGKWRVVVSPQNKVSIAEFDKIIPYAKNGYEIFIATNEYFHCFSAKAAEEIFPHIDDKNYSNKQTLKLAQDLNYKIKIIPVRVRKQSLLSFDYFKSLWHNAKSWTII